MTRKNPDDKPLEIVETKHGRESMGDDTYAVVLSNLAVANAILWNKGKDAGRTHYIAIVKELEHLCGFRFQIMETPGENQHSEDRGPGEESLGNGPSR